MGIRFSSKKEILKKSLYSLTWYQREVSDVKKSYIKKQYSYYKRINVLNSEFNWRVIIILFFRYSGSDIANMVNDALMAPVRSLDKTRVWVEVYD